jgi:cytoskeletal protein RodZ
MYINVQGVHMKLFNRRKKVIDTNIPPEVQAYSQAEHRERMGVAWLVGVVSLVLTIFVLAGLFFGGRWLYRAIAGPTNNESQTQTTDKEQTSEDKQQANDENTSTSKPENDSTAPSNNTPQAVPATPTPATTPTTGPSIPRTGPDSDE